MANHPIRRCFNITKQAYLRLNTLLLKDKLKIFHDKTYLFSQKYKTTPKIRRNKIEPTSVPAVNFETLDGLLCRQHAEEDPLLEDVDADRTGLPVLLRDLHPRRHQLLHQHSAPPSGPGIQARENLGLIKTGKIVLNSSYFD